MTTGNRRDGALGELRVLEDDILCSIVEKLPLQAVLNLACVSSVFYILCTEEPVWMKLCLDDVDGQLKYRGSWRETALTRIAEEKGLSPPSIKPRIQFNGFSSMHLYRRWYRCHVALADFARDEGTVERRAGLGVQEFLTHYDGKQPVILTDQTQKWAASEAWRLDQLVEHYSDVTLKVAQSHGKKVRMRLPDYVDYMGVQRDEDPLYIFDEQFGERAPGLLADYSVPPHFPEDLLALMDKRRRPPYRWFLIGPVRSGASWHIDPALTAAWNALVSGRKRWGLYPPGRVPPGVVVHVDEDTGEIEYDGPTSLQWWLDIYPNLRPEDRPIECTQLPGDIISVPSGWWHCVLNIEDSVAVTQNFVNAGNLEAVLLDMATGYRHRGLARAGQLALNEERKRARDTADRLRTSRATNAAAQPDTEPPRAAKQPCSGAERGQELSANCSGTGERRGEESQGCEERRELDAQVGVAHWLEKEVAVMGEGWLELVRAVIEDERVGDGAHFRDEVGENGYLRSKDVRMWLRWMWEARPDLQDRLWKCACIMFGADRWLARVEFICRAHGIPTPTGLEKLPLGAGTNPVYVTGDAVIKMYVEESDGSICTAKTRIWHELALYSAVAEADSSLKDMMPAMIAMGALHGPPAAKHSDAQPPPFRVVTAEALLSQRSQVSKVPLCGHSHVSTCADRPEKLGEEAAKSELDDGYDACKELSARAGLASAEEGEEGAEGRWAYTITRKCEGQELSVIFDEQPLPEDMVPICNFVGDALRLLHSLPLPSSPPPSPPPPTSSRGEDPQKLEALASPHSSRDAELARKRRRGSHVPPEPEDAGFEVPRHWRQFVRMLRRQRRHVVDRLRECTSIPDVLLDQVDAYLPPDPAVLAGLLPSCCGQNMEGEVISPVWLHTDIHGDNILCVRRSRQEEEGEEHQGGVNGSADRREDCVRSNGGHNSTTSSSPPVADGPEGLAKIGIPHCEGRQVKHPCKGRRTFEPWYLIDFGDAMIGDAMYELVPLHLGLFLGRAEALTGFLKRYGCHLFLSEATVKSLEDAMGVHTSPSCFPPLWPILNGGLCDKKQRVLDETDGQEVTSLSSWRSWKQWERLSQPSYRALAYSLLHEQNFVGDLFATMKELKKCKTLEEVETLVWGPLNDINLAHGNETHESAKLH